MQESLIFTSWAKSQTLPVAFNIKHIHVKHIHFPKGTCFRECFGPQSRKHALLLQDVVRKHEAFLLS